VRVVAVAVALLASAVSAAGGRTGAAGPVAFLRGGNLVVVDLSTGRQTVALRNAGTGPVGWSGDGKLVSSGGRIAGGPALPAGVWSAPGLAWAPTGEIAAYVTRQGGVVTWSPERGSRTIVPDGWGATALAWSRDGRLAIGRSVCRRPCGAATRRGLWVWAQGRAPRRVLELTRLGGEPMPVLWDARGRVIWWLWPGSSSIAADGVAVYAGARRIGTALMYRDYVVTCGKGLALAAGVDRNSMHGKSIEVDGRDVSRDSSRSWVSPSCSGDGSVVVASPAPDRNEGPGAASIARSGSCCRPGGSSRARRPVGRTRTRTCSPTARSSSSEPARRPAE
jgi:hypothetical protein